MTKVGFKKNKKSGRTTISFPDEGIQDQLSFYKRNKEAFEKVRIFSWTQYVSLGMLFVMKHNDEFIKQLPKLLVPQNVKFVSPEVTAKS